MIKLPSPNSFVFVMLFLLLPIPVRAQDPCEEPLGHDYLRYMEAASAAIEREAWEVALQQLLTAREHYRPALLDYAVARTYHNMEQYQDAIDEYQRFLRRFAGCPDPAELERAAINYRNLAIEQLATQVSVTHGPAAESGFPWSWVVLGSGTALVASGVIFDLANMGLDDDLERAYLAGDVNRAEMIEGDRGRAETVDALLYGSGLTLLVVGLVLTLLDSDDGSATRMVFLRSAPSRDGLHGVIGLRF